MSARARSVDFVSGSLWDKILKYALPLAATGILQQLFNAADIAVVGQYTGEKGEAAMAAVGANTPIISLIINTFIGIALGTNVVIANAVGSRDDRTVSKAVHTSVLISLIVGVCITGIGELLAEPIISAQNVPEDVLPMAVQYFRIYMAGVPVILLYNFEASIFRGVGNTRTPLLVLMMAGVLNVAFNLLFVLGLGMTVEGVALATVISNLISSSLLLRKLLRSEGAIQLRLRELRADKKVLMKILRIGIPSGMQSAVFSTANMLIQRSINSLGTTVMAASSAALNIEIFAYNVLNSFGQACTTFTGQNYGAGKLDRCKKVLKLSYLEGVIATATSIGLILTFGRFMLSVFNPNEEVIEVGYTRLIIIFTAYIFSLTYEVISGYLRGFGISATPAILTTIGICGVRFTWIFAVFPRYKTFKCIMTAYPLSLGTTAVFLVIALMICRPAARAQRLMQKPKESKS
ncbi:MAG: MATE family efflux transporter [Ruminococcus sp.]|nr:MATE family efflux transporter [Ruminococcus sp.]